NGNVPLHQWKQRREYSVMEDRWHTDTERRDMTVWLFDEESFVPMAMIKEGRSYSILTDQLGTPTEAYDAEGNEVWSRVLDMDGNVIEETGNKGMVPFLFQGQYYDCETGLAYNRFRYYSPKMGMYVSQDPIGLAGGILNLYGYVSDTNLIIDLYGLDWNYVLINSKGEVYYSGRASDNANINDVARRHAGTKGTDGPRFGEGDTIVQITKKGTDRLIVRGIEQVGIDNSSVSLLGYRSDNVRGNKINGIRDKNSEKGKLYMRSAEKKLKKMSLSDRIANGERKTFEEYRATKKNSYG
ncbi:RHS repeat domain-containing protein, partial [Bacteroides fragilis]